MCFFGNSITTGQLNTNAEAICILLVCLFVPIRVYLVLPIYLVNFDSTCNTPLPCVHFIVKKNRP